MHSDLTPAQRQARENFDLDKAMAALPQDTRWTPTTKGAAGYRLRGQVRSNISDALLREFAKETLGAVRMSAQYLEALRIVLGNQAHAERNGYTLEMNVKNTFTTERVMRNIIDQMKTAGITTGRRVSLGDGRTQVVQVYQLPRENYEGEEHLVSILRDEERAMDRRLLGEVWSQKGSPDIPESEVPY